MHRGSVIRGGAKGATSTGKCGPHCSVEHELAVEGGGITSGEDKVQDGTEGVGEKDGMQEKVKREGEGHGNVRPENQMGHLSRHVSHPG